MQPQGRRRPPPSPHFQSVASYLDFYSNIPDYTDLHDLSDSEFYSKLNTLKETQKHFYSTSASAVDEGDDSVLGSGFGRPSSCSSLESKLTPCKPIDRQQKKYSILEERPMTDALVIQPKPIKPPPPKIVISRDEEKNSDQASSLLGNTWDKGDDNWDKCKEEGSEDEDYIHNRSDTPHHCHHHHDFYHSMGALSIHSSGLHMHGRQSRSRSRGKGKQQKHQVPLLSRIPLFDKIMAEQEERRRIIHERNSQELRALVQPFSFTKREEAQRQALEGCATPDLRGRCRAHTPAFKAKPIPKNLFSEMAYDRMREDQFYRALRKKIRADEMLKSAAMPPGMEAREKLTKGKSKSLDFLDKKVCRRRGYRRAQENIAREVRVTESQHHSGKSAWMGRKHTKSSTTTDSSADGSPNASTLGPHTRHRPHSALSISRSNLASVLRQQTCRNRLESEMKEKLEEREQQMQARFKERLVRLSPAWRQLDYSTEDDLALRLAQRRHEAKLRGARHRQFMDSVYGRVHEIPPLFQEPGRTHSCPSKRKEARSKSLESRRCQREANIQDRKTRSFYLDRTHSESSHLKSDNSKELTATDSDSLHSNCP